MDRPTGLRRLPRADRPKCMTVREIITDFASRLRQVEPAG